MVTFASARLKAPSLTHGLGGGYALPASSAHVEYLWRLYQELGHQGHDVAIILLAYITAPLATYPTQLNEAADLLQYLLEEEERHPSDVTMPAQNRFLLLNLMVCVDCPCR